MGGLADIHRPPYNVGTISQRRPTTCLLTSGHQMENILFRRNVCTHVRTFPNGKNLHCDHRMSAPIRLILTASLERSISETKYLAFHQWYGRAQRYFNRKHNTILYTKGLSPTFNAKVTVCLETQKNPPFRYFKTDKDGRRYQEVRSNNKTYIHYVDEKKMPMTSGTSPLFLNEIQQND